MERKNWNEQNERTCFRFYNAPILDTACNALYLTSLCFFLLLIFLFHFGLWSSMISVTIIVGWWHWRKGFVYDAGDEEGIVMRCCNCPLFRTTVRHAIHRNVWTRFFFSYIIKQGNINHTAFECQFLELLLWRHKYWISMCMFSESEEKALKARPVSDVATNTHGVICLLLLLLILGIGMSVINLKIGTFKWHVIFQLLVMSVRLQHIQSHFKE